MRCIVLRFSLLQYEGGSGTKLGDIARGEVLPQVVDQLSTDSVFVSCSGALYLKMHFRRPETFTQTMF